MFCNIEFLILKGKKKKKHTHRSVWQWAYLRWQTEDIKETAVFIIKISAINILTADNVIHNSMENEREQYLPSQSLSCRISKKEMLGVFRDRSGDDNVRKRSKFNFKHKLVHSMHLRTSHTTYPQTDKVRHSLVNCNFFPKFVNN